MGLRVWLTSPCYQYSPGHLSPTQEAVSGLDLVVVVQDPWSVVVFGATRWVPTRRSFAEIRATNSVPV